MRGAERHERRLVSVAPQQHHDASMLALQYRIAFHRTYAML
jgi:hypothetical protein